MQETERVAFLLTSLARLSGQWQMALPASLSAARETAASFLAFAGLPTATETCLVHCPPVSPAEKVPCFYSYTHAFRSFWTRYV